MWIALLAALASAVPTPEEATAAMTAVNDRTHGVGFVFLLDSSRTVEALTEAVRGDIADLVQVLPEGDEVTILAFHTRPYASLPRTRITHAGRAKLVESIRTIDLPGGFDRDLGDGLNELAALLSDPAAAQFQHVVGISNFCHAPTTMSEWGTGARGCGPIRNQNVIGKRVKPLVEERRLQVRWFPVRDGADLVDMAGADAARRQFGGELLSDAPATWLQNFRERITAERPRPAAAHDAREARFTLTASEPDREGNLQLTLTSTAHTLDLALENLAWTGLEGAPPSALLLSPSVTLPARLLVPPGRLSLFRRNDRVDVPVQLTADGRLGPAAALSVLALEPRRPDLSAVLSVAVTREVGPPPAVSALLLFAIFVLGGSVAVLVRGRIMPLQLGGTLHARFQGGTRTPLPIAHRREAAIVLPADGGAPTLGEADRAALILRVRRPVWQLYAEVEVKAANVEINGKPVQPGIHAIVPGATSFRAGEWRLTWE